MDSWVVFACLLALGQGDAASTGPGTEKRFPPLKVPAGFRATLFACDPLIEYPSVIAGTFAGTPCSECVHSFSV